MQVTHLMRSILSTSLLVGLVIMGTAQGGNAQGKDIVDTAVVRRLIQDAGDRGTGRGIGRHLEGSRPIHGLRAHG